MKSFYYSFLLLLTTLTFNSIVSMSWTCSGGTQKELVDNLRTAGIICSAPIARVMARVDRKYFCPTNHPYQDSPQPTIEGQTISAPHMHAHALELLLPRLTNAKPPLQVLDVGCGSGYLTACFAELLQLLGKTSGSKVYGMDVYSTLVESSTRNIQAYCPELLHETISIAHANGWEGMPHKTFDAIHVGAAAPEIPQALLMQLKLGGVMILPVGPNGGLQHLYQVSRTNVSPLYQPKDFLMERLLGVRYVPLIQPNGGDSTD
jgi:protein-L-isoaspartate(D-aspartate) O-methyltransferase